MFVLRSTYERMLLEKDAQIAFMLKRLEAVEARASQEQARAEKAVDALLSMKGMPEVTPAPPRSGHAAVMERLSEHLTHVAHIGKEVGKEQPDMPPARVTE